MENNNFQLMQSTSYLSGSNASYIEDLYEQFLADPQAVAQNWRDYFQSLPKADFVEIAHAPIRQQFLELNEHKQPRQVASGNVSAAQLQVIKLIAAYRNYGHYQANLDPLNLAPKCTLPELALDFYQLSADILQTQVNAEDFVGLKQATVQEVYTALQETYCGSLGIEYMHICELQQRSWLQQRLETKRAKPQFSVEQQRRILQMLTAAEGLERYLGTKYVGQKRFSLEGGDSLIPLLDVIIQGAAAQQTTDIVMGMAHRGRLNVLINILGKAPAELFKEFEGIHAASNRSGDVKYHMGFSTDLKTPHGKVHLALGFNPSHLEIINPVVEGSVCARQLRSGDHGHSKVIPVLIHGDAAFAGQGVVMETLNASQTRGYATGGTIHIVINNQVGFTTSNVQDARSTPYCTDVAKMIQAPILHVNGDDPEAVVFAAQLALDFRMTFKKDVVIDLVCYRRHGHNEADEPAATQPVMYRCIKQHDTTRKIYADKLVKAGVLTADEPEQLVTAYRDLLDSGKSAVDAVTGGNSGKFAADWTPYLDQEWTAAAKTGFPSKQLRSLAQKLETLPDGMTLQPQVARMLDDRRKMTAGELPLNWGYAETLAYASLLDTGYGLRLSGQDSGRGTFAHRHAVLHDFNTDNVYMPLQHLSKKQGSVQIIDSYLSEEAVVGFEYGYACTDPETFVIWEAQFGDFANGAQVVIDQFISSGEQKWGRLCGLTMLLPHGYEGMGPEHSSARLERYLQLCAEHNMQVCVPSTPAQIFHLLRRQMLRPFRKPLIVMTPKSLLRHKAAVSSLADLTDGKFYTVIPEVETAEPNKVTRVVFCSGKVYYDLADERRNQQLTQVALIRIEQLYPFDDQAVLEILKTYPKAKELVWCQEEPMNQGAWYQIQHRLVACVGKGQTLHYAGRKASASPAVGYASLHTEQQLALVKQALLN